MPYTLFPESAVILRGSWEKNVLLIIAVMGKKKKTKSGKGQIIVDFEVDAELVFLVVKNTGRAPALNLKIKPTAAIIGLEGKTDIAKLSIFEEISYLAPGKEIKIFVDSYESFFRHLKDWLISFALNYKDERDRWHKAKITHNLEIYSDLIFFIKKS
jgi:hypothetical protein